MTTLTFDAARTELIRSLEAGEQYRFLMMVDPYLQARADDHYLRLMAAREYLKLQLVVPAREVLAEGEHLAESPPEFDMLQQSLPAHTGAAIPWSRHADRFEANLAALADRGVEPALIRDPWTTRRDDYQWFCDAHGVDQIRMRGAAGRWRWIPYLGHHKSVSDAQPLPEDIKQIAPGPYLFEGLDLGWYFQRVFSATLDTFLGYSCALFVVEPQADLLAVVLHLHDWRTILSDPRVFWFIGPGCTEALRKVWDADYDLPWPRQAFTLSAFRPPCHPGSVEVIHQEGTRRERQIATSRQELETRYAAADLDYWAKRFDEALSGRGEPLRILAAVSTHTTFLKHSMRDARRALEALGHRCVVLTEKTAYGVTGPLTYHQAIRELNPDVFFVLDHLRPEFEAFLPRNLPILTWDQDQLPHVFTVENIRRIARHDFLVGCSKSKFVVEGGNPKQFLHARVPTCPEQFGGDPLSDSEIATYTCDISYVSHASQTPKRFHEQERASCPDAKTTALLDTVYELMPAMLAKYRVARAEVWDALLVEACRHCDMIVAEGGFRTWLWSWDLWRLGERLFRHEALEWVAQWARKHGRSFRIYGNGWENHPSLAEFAAGPADNGRELLCIYRASRLNLQLMPAGFIHQRALDGLASGGFFLTRYVPGDLRGRTLRALVTRIRDTGLSTTRELLATTDQALRTLLSRYQGEWLHRSDATRTDLFNEIELSAELTYPDEVFPHFEDIVFDSAEQFAATANRFLADDDKRRAVAAEMRQVVIQRFSYRPAMEQFLTAMADYVKEAAASAEC